MRELRSIVNGVFAFLVFLLVYSFARVPFCKDCPRYVRMEVQETRNGVQHTRSHLKVPFFLIRGAARVASLGQLERELDLHIKDSIECEDIRGVLADLDKAAAGTEVTREHGDGGTWTFKKDGSTLLVTGKDDDQDVTVRLPLHLIQTLTNRDRDLDVDSILAELKTAEVGDLVDVRDRDTHVKIWIE